MESALQRLYEVFYHRQRNTPEDRRVQRNRDLLRQRLSKQERKLLLRIGDDKDLLIEKVGLESFVCGFRLAMEITAEMNNTGGQASHENRED